MKNQLFRHGDVSLHPVEKSQGKKVEHNGSFVVELGEATGHRHVLTVERPADLIIRKTAEGKFYFELFAQGKLTHEEHKTITLPPGIYRKENEREMDWFANAVRRVLD